MDAARAYKEEAIIEFGEYAHINVIEEYDTEEASSIESPSSDLRFK